MAEPVARERKPLSPAVAALIAVNVVLVLTFFVLLASSLTRGGGAEEAAPPPSPTEEATSLDAAPPDEPGEGDEVVEGDVAESDEGDDDGADTDRQFASPSGNIVCSITAEAAECTIAQLSEAGVVEDETCDGVVGHVVRVDSEGAERPCLTGSLPDPATSGTPVLEYEDSVTEHGYTCNSSTAGILCRHDATGHGFSVARAGSSLF